MGGLHPTYYLPLVSQPGFPTDTNFIGEKTENKMIDFKMKIVCHHCWSRDNDWPGDNSIEIDPLPICLVSTEDICWMINGPRQRYTVEKHGWIVSGDNAFCCADCANDYYEGLKANEAEDMMRDGG